ncbi:ATP12 family chaperone protein [Rhodovulum sp. DZ06]|uniref:ATP12 family chaperone protein n=1 Tax=Rhodovulum sp. DZ06 TaxID=3425126 RepID=UPI003D324F8F
MKLSKRFWKSAAVAETDEKIGDLGIPGFAVELDGRRVKTPVGRTFLAPTRAMAEAAAAEWEAQEENVNPLSMPVTRAVNVALDRVIPERAAVQEIVAAYGETDLLCYRAEWPEELAGRQAAGWDPLLSWAETRHGAPLVRAAGIMHAAQPGASVAALTAAVAALDPFELTALHEFVVLSGSLVIGLAILDGAVEAETAWGLSRIDEDFQAEQWGVDEEAEALAARKRKDFLQAERFLALVRG